MKIHNKVKVGYPVNVGIFFILFKNVGQIKNTYNELESLISILQAKLDLLNQFKSWKKKSHCN